MDRRAIEAVATLGDGQRGRLYDVVRRAGRPVTREECATAVGISRKLAAFHLDKLVAAGLLRVAERAEDAPRAVGRSPKLYQPVVDAVAVSIPARSHGELAAILVDAAVEQDGGESAGESPEQTRDRVARAHGRRLAQGVDRAGARGRLGRERALALVESSLDEQGFEPYRPTPDRIRLRNCPFHPLAERAPGLVCGINEAFLSGYLEGLDAKALRAVLEPCPGECCVEIQTR